jgi:hypothetical protein
MTTEDRIMNFCRYCDNRSYGFEEVMKCKITRKPPEFETTCENFKNNEPLRRKILRQEMLQPRADAGRKKTILICVLFGILSIGTFVFTLMTMREIPERSIFRSVIRMILEFALLYGIYIGNKKIKNIVTVLFVMAVILAIIGFFRIITVSWLGVIFIPMIALYIYIVIFINTSEDYDAFAELQSEFYD